MVSQPLEHFGVCAHRVLTLARDDLSLAQHDLSLAHRAGSVLAHFQSDAGWLWDLALLCVSGSWLCPLALFWCWGLSPPRQAPLSSGT